MTLVVVDYPTVSREDFDWMQSIRAEHDELYYEVDDPHLAFVFPVFDFDRERFLERVKGYTRGVERISFVCGCAAVVKDATNEYAHVFLEPDEGHSEIIKLHDRLYEGPCPLTCGWTSPSSSHRRRERDRPKACKAIADGLNREEFEIGAPSTRLLQRAMSTLGRRRSSGYR